MKLSDTTMTVLRNFASLNPNLFVPAGSVVRTWTPSKEVLAEATLDQDFPVDFGIYEMPKLLAALSLVKGDTDIKFTEKKLSVNNGQQRLEYFYSDPSLLSYPTKMVKMPDCEIEFELTWETLAALKKAASTLGFTQLVLLPDGDRLMGVVTDARNLATSKTENSYTVELGHCTTDKKFRLVLNMSNFNFIQGDYAVSIAAGKIAQMSNKEFEGRLKYWVLFDKESTEW